MPHANTTNSAIHTRLAATNVINAPTLCINTLPNDSNASFTGSKNTALDGAAARLIADLEQFAFGLLRQYAALRGETVEFALGLRQRAFDFDRLFDTGLGVGQQLAVAFAQLLQIGDTRFDVDDLQRFVFGGGGLTQHAAVATF